MTELIIRLILRSEKDQVNTRDRGALCRVSGLGGGRLTPGFIARAAAAAATCIGPQGKLSAAAGGRSLADGAWRTELGGRSLADGAWRTELGGRSLADGAWRTELGGRSLVSAADWKSAADTSVA